MRIPRSIFGALRRGPIWPILLVATAVVLAVGGVCSQWSCTQTGAPTPGATAQREGIPYVRVLITPEPLERVAIAASGPCRLDVDGVALARSRAPLKATTLSRRDGQWKLGPIVAGGRRPRFALERGGHFTIDGVAYRGEIFLLPSGSDAFQLVNRLDMESYLAGVLAKELYPDWPIEAYRALAVAARTFATYHSLTYGASHEYDLGSTQAAQVYGGLAAETAKAWQALHSTRGQILAWGEDGDERVFLAQYSSCCGGRVNAADAIRNARDIPPLQGGQVCPYCGDSPRYRWPAVRFAKADIHRALVHCYQAAASLSGVAEIRPVERTTYGRVIWVDVLDASGASIRLRAEDIRLALLRANVPDARNLYSMNCRWRDAGDAIEFYDGRGFGHGVGLCQWGARGMAAAGATGEQILRFYYPGAKLHRSY